MSHYFRIVRYPGLKKIQEGKTVRFMLLGDAEQFKSLGISATGEIEVSIEKIEATPGAKTFLGTSPRNENGLVLPPSVVEGYISNTRGHLTIRPSPSASF